MISSSFDWSKLDGHAARLVSLWLKVVREQPAMVARNRVCVGEVASVCGQSCTGGGGGGGGGGSGGGSTCSHSICAAGKKLTNTCDSCAADICSQDSYCCTTKWDSQCVSEVSSICNESCN